MRYLGFDLGTRTLGISISDLTGVVASTYETLRFSDSNYQEIIPKILDIIKKENIRCIVLGLPKNMNNTYGDATDRVLEFKKILEQNTDIEIVLQDERLSTKEASYYMILADVSRKKRKKKIDALAANIILQTYLDKIKGENYGNK
ncbi:MAG: Holliday junction resolvase RuvX [Clostridium sp.]|nr:Holliday junction resolvase RuvX [Clostridium sp.]MCM1444123.1 Holliday junction resolvase RuvX [Candidatus Amulumruptor caecigallinarius]